MILRISQTELATAIGISFQQLGKYEKGENRIGAGRLHQLAKLLKVDAAYFFEGAAGEKQKVGMAGLPSYVAEFVALPEGKRLMQAFIRIRDPGIRRNIKNFTASLAD